MYKGEIPRLNEIGNFTLQISRPHYWEQYGDLHGGMSVNNVDMEGRVTLNRQRGQNVQGSHGTSITVSRVRVILISVSYTHLTLPTNREV